MMSFRIEYLDFTSYGGIAQYAITVKGKALQSVEREFYNKIPTAWDVTFTEVTTDG